ncbi:TRAP transporter small permease subunit [Brevirhabdus sp.]|uniref:TRAP transporter small permease subunit n=1 Tax=Brevirhabdus sp. TaxID=2004514 RepID=UPI004058D2B0
MSGRDPLDTDLAATSEALAERPHTREPSALPQAGALGRAVNAGGYFFAAMIVLSAVILLIEVFLRYVFNAPTIWAHETTTFLCAISFLYGGLFCAARDTHIRVVLIYDMLSGPVRRLFDVAIFAACAVAAGFFTYAGYIMVAKATFAPTGDFRLERSGSAWNPPTPALVKIFLFLMLIVLTIQFLVLAYNHARRMRRGRAQ